MGKVRGFFILSRRAAEDLKARVFKAPGPTDRTGKKHALHLLSEVFIDDAVDEALGLVQRLGHVPGEIEEAVEYAKNAPFPALESALEDVYAD